MKAAPNTEPAADQDLLCDCITELLAHYDLYPDLSGLLKQLPREPGPLTITDLQSLAQRLKLDLEVTEVTTNFSGHLPDPVVIVEQASNLPRVVNPDDQAQISTPSLIVLLKPASRASAVDLDHMQRGHALDWFWHPLRSHRKHFTEVLIATVFINTFVLLIPLFTLSVYDQVIPNFAEETLIALAVGISLALIFDFLLKVVRSYLLERVAADVGTQYDNKLMERVLAIHPEAMRLSVGERTNLFRELQGIREFYASKLIPTAVDLPFFIMFMAVIYIISPVLTLVPVIGAVVILAISSAIQIPINRATADYFASSQYKSSLLVETLQGAQTYSLFNARGPRLFRWSTANKRVTRTSRMTQFLFGLGQTASLSLVHIVHILVVVVGVYQIQSGSLTVGGLIACTILASRAIAPIVNVGGVVSRWQQSRDVLGSIDTLFKLPYEDAQSGVAAQNLKGSIKLEGVSYTYPGAQRNALSNLTIDIQAGEHIGIIGPTGAGKSTLAGILTGQMKDYQGLVSYDGYDLATMAPASLRDQLAIVPQTPFLISGTIRDNLLLGSPASSEQIDRALYLSGLETVIKQTGFGLDTPVGENGSHLSGGQRQAISLARALIFDPRILIFDEPTTGLDSTLENHFKQNLRDYLDGRTFLMITHRTALLDLVDRLILLNNGQLVKDGQSQQVIASLSTPIKNSHTPQRPAH